LFAKHLWIFLNNCTCLSDLISRWFAIFYLIFMFFLFPLYVFGLSLIGPVAIYIGFLPLLFLMVVVVLINVAQVKLRI
jgi:hypothetical protein